ncbi:MAG: hypothetical protein AAFV45_00995 [Pseudomonadota bacterium]
MPPNDMCQTDYAPAEDDSLRAFSLIEAAWMEGEETGVPTEMMAYAAIFAAMRGLVGRFGEDAVADLAKRLEQRVQLGEFSENNTRQ